ncbi:MAG: hypothetical protein Hyperionvirus1_158 [Hyperionvirus sp.]|uniref:Uncharacterized protein n=1 Tax=Hyperionvirus sp. TaxID=2487770 RepID=A0A3G5AB99_9VIRU|nr:MAG: hypothetical protein Hyperionvirus1_158 [Hyperionvirus sp.]
MFGWFDYSLYRMGRLGSMFSAEEIKRLGDLCYKSNNRFAYKYDLTGRVPEGELKIFNFVPTYDKWCLFCDKKECKQRCSICIACGSDAVKTKCAKCPVKYCGNDKCKKNIEKAHEEFDCNHFSIIFKNLNIL